MKRIFTLIIILYSAPLYSQSGWIQQNSGVTVWLHGLYFTNVSTGWVCGDSGTVLKTTNGGTTWIEKETPTLLPLRSVHFINDNTGWCSGGKGDFNSFPNFKIVLKTTNAGETWTTNYYTLTFYEGLTHVWFNDENNGFVVQDGGTGSGNTPGLFRSVNGGSNWTEISSCPAYGNIIFTDNNTGWVAGYLGNDVGWDTGYVFKTIDGGMTWNKIYQRFDFYARAISFIDNNNGWIIGRDYQTSTSKVLKTTDGGSSFESYTVLGLNNINSISFKSENKGWVSGNKILATTDGGQTWNPQTDVTAYLGSVLFVDTLNGWAVGGGGTIYSTRTGGITSIFENPSLPESYFLSQNYPNPFNPSTTIEFGIPNTANVKIEISNVLGQIVSVPLNESRPAGNHTIAFNGNGLESGTYFYRLIVDGELLQSKIMMLVK